MFAKIDTKKGQFLEQTKAARAERAQERVKEKAAQKIQAVARGFLCRQRFKKGISHDVDKLLQIPGDKEEEYKPTLLPALEVFQTIKKYFFAVDEGDTVRFEYLCRYLLISVDSDNLRTSYVSVAMTKKHVLPWIQQLKDILWRSSTMLGCLKPESHNDMKVITVHLRLLITFTSPASWKILKGKTGEALTPGMSQLCNNVMGHLNSKGIYKILQGLLTRGLARPKPVFTRATLTAIITLALRPLMSANFSDNLLTVFLLHILSVPAIIYHISHTAHECMSSLITHRIFKRCLDLMTNEQSTRIIFNSLEGNYALCLMANLIHLGYTELEGLVENTLNFMIVMIRLLESCKMYVQNKRSNLTHWHPVLGWFSQNTDQSLHEAMPYVVKQLQLLWSERMIRLLFSVLLEYVEATQNNSTAHSPSSPTRNILKKALVKASSSKTVNPKIKLDSSVATSTCMPCALYRTALQTLSQLRSDILGGLSYNETLLPILWRFLSDLGPSCGLKTFLDLLGQAPNSTIHPVFSLLTLFCETSSHLIITLDDMEMYEQQKVFKMPDFVKMSEFLNLFVFRVIWHGLMDIQTAGWSDVFSSSWNLLMILHERDARRSYTQNHHWLVRDVKASHFMGELERGRKTVQFLMQKVPHIIPFHERVILFRKNVAKEKDALGLTESVCTSPQSTLITVHRSRIVEDGYRQLAQLPSRAMKGVIRVKFINEQGLDEAGIDQDGVFKEFLEETIARVFDPALNLFKVTSEQKLYPSSTSYIQENHLALFEFVGKMLAKALYEGIVVDIPFAPFFLTQLLGRQQSSTYSSLDELPSLDPELAKSLTYIKHYDGDMCDLELTFSCDEDCMGRLETHELVPGGKAISVTNENKIRYVHLMAHFRMYRQIKEQTLAFIRGFKAVVNPDWLQMFSAPELQKLISGDNMEVDIEDLRRHTQYYGGYHNNHKVINWLWDILEKDLTFPEKGLFLKFVTSCSKPPLLGFANLEPPFSIRCVEVSDDQDTGDTVGSVLKGFFNIKKKDAGGRLPTSSTCFNLLKLPNYSKKSILRDKLRYAIHSHSGFEIS
ncbi:ubiquitin-protein ligase E3B-like [Haliotis rufescens]|uniref:ubiquitin-protein ligase E3B-like n=1 Tax=Haliotis rufescens TaxID=6454 RepID=UPI001EB0A515|nr:ubiquitin-protein ligase E3B-like [Haliotis rufescens]